MTQNINNLPDFESKENKYKMLIDFSPDCIKIFNSENKIEYLSKGGLEEHNFHSEQDAIGFNWLDSVVPEQRDEILAKIKESVDDKKTVSIDIKHLPELANREWCSLTIKPIFNDDGSLKYFIGVSRDITERKKTEESLTRLALIAEVTSDFVSIADMNGNLLYLNQAGKKMIGLDADVDVNKLKIADFHPKWATKIILEKGIPEAMEKGVWSGETALRHQNGQEIPVSQIIIVHKNLKGEVDLLATTLRDISEHKKLLENAETAQHLIAKEKYKMDAILHSIGDGVFVVDENLKVILINKVAAKMTGYKMEDILGAKYSDKIKFIFEDTGKINDQFINKAIETRTIQEMSNHTALINKNGSKIPVADSAAPLLNAEGKVTGCVVVFRDVTREREVDKVKTEFVSLASHQLRTPLSAINWYTEMLLAGDVGEMNEEQKKYLGEVALGSKRMVDLVNALLNVSHLDLGTFIVEPEPTNVVEIAKNVVNELKPQIIEKKLKVEELYGDNIPEFQADKKLLRIVFQNLLSNAVKYTPSEGLVRMELLVALKGQNFGGKNITEDSITIKISDTGIGIPDRQKDKIFLKLFRADNARETDTEGTGLGLYIIKSIVDHSEGLIWFESEENKGTTFYVIFPLSGMKKKEGTKKLD